MNRNVRLPTIIVVILVVAISCSLARPYNDEKHSRRGSGDENDSSFARESEVRDLLSAGNAPKKRVDGKKRMKNSSGKSDEGGFYKTYGSDAEGEKGYLQQTYSKGDHGYKTLDTFHKKDGDNYGFEKHIAFGKARGDNEDGRHAKSASYSTKENGSGDHEGAGTDTHYVHEEDDGNTEAEGGDESGESGAYTDGGDGETYTSDGDSGHYSDADSDGYNEHFSSEGGEEGSYGTHGSYSSGGEGGDFYSGEYD